MRSAAAVVAVGGGFGTLSEIALALKMERPVIGIYSWDIPGVEAVTSARDAVSRVTQLAG